MSEHAMQAVKFAPQAENIEVSIPMSLAGVRAYKKWRSVASEREKINGPGNLVSEIYRAMELERRGQNEGDF